MRKTPKENFLKLMVDNNNAIKHNLIPGAIYMITLSYPTKHIVSAVYEKDGKDNHGMMMAIFKMVTAWSLGKEVHSGFIFDSLKSINPTLAVE